MLKNAEHQGHGGEDETACVMATVPELVNVSEAKPYYAPDDEKPVKMGGLYYYGGSVGVFTPVERYKDDSPGYIGNPIRQIVPEDIPLACRLLYGTAFLGLLVFCAVKLFILF